MPSQLQSKGQTMTTTAAANKLTYIACFDGSAEDCASSNNDQRASVDMQR